MKFLVLLFSTFLILSNKGSCMVVDNGLSDANEQKELLVKISEKLDQWSQKLGDQPNWSELSENVKNLRTCESNQSAGALADIRRKVSGLELKLDRSARSHPDGFPVSASAMKALERKLARLQYSLDRSLLRNGLSPKEDGDKANYQVENIFTDMANKVDALYEKSAAEHLPNFANPKEVKHLGRSCRMLSGPYKKLISSVDYLEKAVRELGYHDGLVVGDSRTGEIRNSPLVDIRNRLEMLIDEVQFLRRRSEKNINENEKILRRIEKKIDAELDDYDEDVDKLKKVIRKYLVDERKTLERNLRKMLREKSDDDDDDDDDDDTECDDSDENGSKSCERRKKKGRKDDTDDDDDDDDDDDVDCDDSDENGSKSCERRKRKKGKSDDTDENDDDDDDDEDGDSDVKCDDSDENGSKSCERERKKAYSRGKKKSKFDDDDLDDTDDDDDDDDDDYYPVRKGSKRKNYKVRKSVKSVEAVKVHDAADKLVADEPVAAAQVQVHPPPDGPEPQRKIPDVKP